MSTENTQTDVAPSGDAIESSGAQSGQTQDTVQASSPETFNSVEGLKKASKDMEASKFKVTTVDEAMGKKPEATTAAPAYTPNYKYKAALQEKEVDEFWRTLIKDADSEKKVKEALTKLDGFEFVKQSRDKVQQQFESLTDDYKAQNEIVQRVDGALQRGDLSSAFRQLGLKDEDIFKWTQSRLQMMEMPADQRKAFEDAESLREQQLMMKEQMTQYQKLYEDQAVQARTMQLDFVLSRPEIAQAAQGWDTLQGQPGSFRDLVIQEAQTAYYQTGRDLTAEQAAQAVMQKFGRVLSSGGQQPAPQAQVTPNQTPQVMAPHAKPVIPNVSGKGASPIKKAPKNLDDLKRMAKELTALENAQ
jgi:hypothetical protein